MIVFVTTNGAFNQLEGNANVAGGNALARLQLNTTTTNTPATSGTGSRDFRFSVAGTAVPEPSSAALLGLGGLALILRRRK